MNRRDFIKTALIGISGVLLPDSTQEKAEEPKGVKAKYYSYVRCPECGAAMLRFEEGDETHITCCGKTYIEPSTYLVLEEVS